MHGPRAIETPGAGRRHGKLGLFHAVCHSEHHAVVAAAITVERPLVLARADTLA
jgi:hypothetical protein